MRSSFSDIKSSLTFPLDDIVGVLDWRGEFFSGSHSDILKLSSNSQDSVVPVFLMGQKRYIPVEFGREFDGKYFFDSSFDSYDDFFDLVKRFSDTDFKRVTSPVKLETVVLEPMENRFSKVLFGLVPLIDGPDLDAYSFNRSEVDIQATFYDVALAGKELSDNGFIDLDIHQGNVVKSTESIFLVDPCLVKVYFRSKGDHLSDRNLYSHYSPEVRYGGLITEKSQVYSIGATLRNILSSEFGVFYENSSLWKKNGSIIDACTSQKPSKRPSSDELVSLLGSL